MTRSLVEFWKQLTGAVHPADVDVLATAPKLFNLDYPPPAYVGDIERAPVVLLMGNGGYKDEETPREFPDEASKRRAIDRLHNPAPVKLNEVCSYYAEANYARWLESGEMALVNAVAYRAPKITSDVERIARVLPSVQAHIGWLKNELLQDAISGKRLVIAHRNRLWNLRKDSVISGVLFSACPASERLSNKTLDSVESFLTRYE